MDNLINELSFVLTLENLKLIYVSNYYFLYSTSNDNYSSILFIPTISPPMSKTLSIISKISTIRIPP